MEIITQVSVMSVRLEVAGCAVTVKMMDYSVHRRKRILKQKNGTKKLDSRGTFHTGNPTFFHFSSFPSEVGPLNVVLAKIGS